MAISKANIPATVEITGIADGYQKTDSYGFSLNQHSIKARIGKANLYLYDLYSIKNHKCRAENISNTKVSLVETMDVGLRTDPENLGKITKLYHSSTSAKRIDVNPKTGKCGEKIDEPIYVEITKITITDKRTGIMYELHPDLLENYNAELFDCYRSELKWYIQQEKKGLTYEELKDEEDCLKTFMRKKLDIAESIAELWSDRILNTYSDEGKRAALLYFIYDVDYYSEAAGVSLWDILNLAWLHPIDALDLYEVLLNDKEKGLEMYWKFRFDVYERREKLKNE